MSKYRPNLSSLDVPLLNFVNETNAHQECYNFDLAMIIPKGKRCLFWFTTYGNQNVCIVIEAVYVNRCSHRYTVKSCFDSSLCSSSGTVLRGTYIQYKNIQIGAVEDVYVYKGRNIQNHTMNQRMSILLDIFEHQIGQERFFQDQCMLTMCYTFHRNTPTKDILNIVKSLPYKSKFIQYRFDSSNRNTRNIVNLDTDTLTANTQFKPLRGYQRNKETVIDIQDLVFRVRPSISEDVYSLFTYDESQPNRELFHGYAGIQNYKTSVFMNKIFRIIKENDNLDLLEQSDDEDEFENIDTDKYVKLDKYVNIVCKYNQNIDKWIPLKIAPRDKKIAMRSQTKSLGIKK
tara:strand:- start:4496 stop:5530 length:1035 start_codon:yes stop_codon:yes gene_type:complete